MKKYLIVFIVILTLIVLGLGFWGFWQADNLDKISDESQASEEYVSGFGNDQVEKAITDFLVTQKNFTWKTEENSSNLCIIENLQPENELFPLYIWAYCAEYAFDSGELEILSGSSGPAKIDYPNELSFYDLDRFSYEVPGLGSNYSQDIKTLFPADVQQKILRFDAKNLMQKFEESLLERTGKTIN